jgi:hypothetical protein
MLHQSFQAKGMVLAHVSDFFDEHGACQRQSVKFVLASSQSGLGCRRINVEHLLSGDAFIY